MTTARAASSATPSVGSAARKAVAVPPRVVRREAAAQEAVPHVAAAHVAAVIPHPVIRVVAAVAQPVMKTTITHRAVVAEAVVDDVLWDTLRVEIYQKS